MRRLFIDPATNKTGWALFVDGVLVESGTINVSGPTVWYRLFNLKNQYRDLVTRLKPDRVFIERMNYRVLSCVWSVSAIALGAAEAGVFIDGSARDGTAECFQISPNSWQAWCGWKQPDSLKEFRSRVGSVDELAAIGMGVYWHEKYIEGRKKSERRNKT